MKLNFCIFFAALMILGAAPQSILAATVQTDQQDYPPGSTVNITGSGFTPGETVQLQVTNITNPDDLGPEHDPWTVTADLDGNFTSTWYVTEDEANTTLQLTATGLTSGLVAQHTFTDATVTAITVGSQTGTLTYGTAGSATFSVSFTKSGSGGSSISGLSVSSGLPAGATASWSSTSSSTGSGPPPPVTLTISNLATTPAGSFTFTVASTSPVLSDSGTLTVAARAITVTAQANTKTYDGTTNSATAPLITVGSLASGDTATLTESYTNKIVGTNKTLIPFLTITNTGGNAKTNYSITLVNSTNGVINKASLTVTATGVNRVYNGTNNATVTLSDNKVSGDSVTDNYTAASFATKTVGTNKTVTVTGISISGTDAGNYSLASTTASTTANITGASLTVSATGVNRVYNGTTNATVTLSDNKVSGDSVTDNYTAASFATKTVGTNKTVSVSGISISGADAGNYSLASTTASTTANITGASLTVTATGVNKVYDGMTNATVTLSDNKVSGDSVTDSYIAANFADKNVGTGKTVTVTGISISGADAGNYSLGNTTATTVADILPATSSVSVVSSMNPTGFKDGVYFTATNLPTDATLNVVFLANGVAFSTNVLGSGGTTSLTITNLPRGTNIITAAYAGDGNYIGSTNDLAGGQIVTNHPPVAGSFSYTNTTSTFMLPIATLLTHATDVDGDTITLAGFSTSTNGVNIVTNATLFQYRDTNYVNDTFNYTVSDGYGGSATGTVSVVFYPFISGQSGTISPVVGGMVQLKYYGIPNYSYGIQRSTNMVSWTTILNTNAPANGVFNYTDNFSDLGAPPSSAYYRLIWNP